MEKGAEIVVRYDGSTADSGRLNLYEASESLEGTTRLVNVIVHAFVNNNEVRERLSGPVGADTYLTGAKKGCFEESVEIVFGDAAIKRIKPTVIVPNFWDYFACCVSVAVGREYQPHTAMVRKILNQKKEALFEEIAEEIEGPLQKLHRPIKTKGAKTITFARPKAGDVFTLDKETLEYVSVLEQADKLENWTGNVTKYNSLSGFGRMYVDELGHTLPFRIWRFKENERAHKAAAASLNERVNEEGGKRKIAGFPVYNSLGRIKRIVVQEINQFF
ncbi:MAG TPA: hypothetical protein VJ654_18535 [Noviherbaspirillum sp.]|nr:hypothetical protein [Noviherbaspirillum sp.]